MRYRLLGLGFALAVWLARGSELDNGFGVGVSDTSAVKVRLGLAEGLAVNDGTLVKVAVLVNGNGVIVAVPVGLGRGVIDAGGVKLAAGVGVSVGAVCKADERSANLCTSATLEPPSSMRWDWFPSTAI